MAIFGLSAKEKKYLPLIAEAANKYGVDIALIFAHIKQESDFNPLALRKEPAIKDASFGLMQVLLKTAKEIDPNATAQKLLDPKYNISIGTQYIARNSRRWGNLSDTIASYNAGRPMKNISGQYVNTQGVSNVQRYVDSVLKHLNSYQARLRGITLPSITPLPVSYTAIAAILLVISILWLGNQKKAMSYAR